MSETSTQIPKEKLTPAERLEAAKKRRQEQLKDYDLYDKSFVKKKLPSSKKRPLTFGFLIKLSEAGTRNDVNEVEDLLKKGANPNEGNDDGITVLHQSSIDNSVDVMKVLLKYGADVNVKDKELWTPLHAAAFCGNSEAVKVLIDNKADLLAVNSDGNMPYDICEKDDTLSIIEKAMFKRGITQEQIESVRSMRENAMLQEIKLAFNANGNKLPKFAGPKGETLLHISAANGYSEITDFLLKNKARVNAADQDDWQPIHCVIYWGQLHLLERFLKYGADLNAKTKTGETALDLSASEIIKKQVLDIRDDLAKKGLIKKVPIRKSSGSRTISNTSSILRLSASEKRLLTNKDSKSEGQELLANKDTVFGQDIDSSGGFKKPEGAVPNSAQRTRRKSSTTFFGPKGVSSPYERVGSDEKRCCVSL